MHVVVLGAGRIGSFVARELARSFEVLVVDKDMIKLESLRPLMDTLVLDVSNEDALINIIKGFDIVVNALPGGLGFKVIKACIRTRKDLVDISFMPENPLPLDKEIRDAGITVVIDAGFAPGLSNILIGSIYRELGYIDEGEINVGCLPKNPKPPLYHTVLFSPLDLIDEYLRPARMLRGGKIVETSPLGIIERKKIMGFEFERFPTDGLRTMLYTIKAIDLTEYTLRWPGHLEKMKTLWELGFLDKENLAKTLEVILPKMVHKDVDISVMEVKGKSGNVEIVYTVYDEARNGDLSIARTTGYTAISITRLLAMNKLNPGLVPPETLGIDPWAFNYILNEIRSTGIIVNTEKHVLDV
ncbi:MAG: saccharopine dehydrogenase C-terminal domain-containing protein [Desulfurococcaceae archaeon]